jgi:microcystin-dependent protein
MAEVFDLDTVDGNNIGRWPEGMQYRDVNNAGRADEGMLARWYKDTNCSLTASGSAGAYSVSSNRTITSYANNLIIGFTANHTNTGAATLAVSGLVAKTIVRPDGSALIAGDIPSGSKVLVVFNSVTDKFQLLSLPATSLSATALGVGTFMLWGTETIPSWALDCTGQSLAVATYPALHAALGYRYGGSGANFNLPNPRGYFLRFHDNAAGVDPDAASRTNRGDGTTGDSVGTKQLDAFKAHDHSAAVTDPGHTHPVPAGSGVATVQNDEADVEVATSADGTSGSATTGITVDVGAEGGNETRGKNISFKLIVVAVPTLMLPQAAIGKNETWFGARHMTSRVTSGAGSATRDSGSSDVTQPVFDFDDTNGERVNFEWAPPKRWDRGTVSYKAYWTSDAGTPAQLVRWRMDAAAVSNDDALNVSYGTEVGVSDTLIATGDLHISDESTVTIGGAPAIADLVVFHFGRDPAHADDNMTGDGRLLGIKLFWTSNATTDD